MLNIFKLTDAISESAIGSTSIASIQPYEFIGSMAECTAEFNYEIMSEAVNFNEFYANSDEIMIEAAVMNPEAIDTLVESVFSKVKEHVTKFINKLIAMVKGIVEKLKAFFFKLTGKTDKWLSIMKPKITKAMGYRGADKVTYEMHEWDDNYVTSGLQSGISAMVAKILPNNKLDLDTNAIARKSDAVGSAAQATRGATENIGDDATKTAVDNIDKKIEELDRQMEADQEKFIADLAKSVGVSESSSLDAVWKGVSEKATGGEKKTVYVYQKADAMLTAIEKSKKTIDDLKKAYDQHVKDLGNFKNKVESEFKKAEVFDKDDKVAGAVSGAVKRYMDKYAKSVTDGLTRGEAACNNARGMNVNFIQTMTTEYMNALTRLANHKEKKD